MGNEPHSTGDFGPERFEIGRPMLLGGLRRRHPFATADSGIADQWREFSELIELPGQIGPTRYGVLCGHDADGFEYLCAVEVASLAALPTGIGRMRVPAQRYAIFVDRNPDATTRSLWQRVFAWLADSECDSAETPDFERYGHSNSVLAVPGNVEVWLGITERVGS